MEFWVDEGHQTPCCQTSDDALIESDPELFDCASCPVLDRVGRLEPENAQAWLVWHDLGTRFVMDAHLAPLALEASARQRGIADVSDLITRLGIIYDVLVPPPKETD